MMLRADLLTSLDSLLGVMFYSSTPTAPENQLILSSKLYKTSGFLGRLSASRLIGEEKLTLRDKQTDAGSQRTSAKFSEQIR